MPRTALLAAVVVLATAALGVLAQVGDAAPGVPSRATALGAPWLLAGFALGALWRRPIAGALAGGFALSGAPGLRVARRVAGRIDARRGAAGRGVRAG